MGCNRCGHGPSERRWEDAMNNRNEYWDRADRRDMMHERSDHCGHERCDQHNQHNRRRGRSIFIGFPLWF